MFIETALIREAKVTGTATVIPQQYVTKDDCEATGKFELFHIKI